MRARNIEFERAVTRQAAKGLLDPEPLIEAAELRARALCGEYVSDHMLVASRDRAREVREELLDARNHLVWWLEDHLEDDTVPRKRRALQAIAIAYNELREDD